MQCMKIVIFSQFRLSVRLSSASVSKELDIIITHFDILVGASFCFFFEPHRRYKIPRGTQCGRVAVETLNASTRLSAVDAASDAVMAGGD